MCELFYSSWVFRWSDNKSSRVSRTLLGILVDLNNTVVLMVLILPLISNCYKSLSNSLGTIPSVLTTIVVTVICIFLFYFYFFCEALVFGNLFTLWSFWNGKIRLISSLSFSLTFVNNNNNNDDDDTFSFCFTYLIIIYRVISINLFLYSVRLHFCDTIFFFLSSNFSDWISILCLEN